jgi:hypothetical protein
LKNWGKEMLTSLIIDYDTDLKTLLTELRQELNLLNTLNCNVHMCQGDFAMEQDVALKRTEATQALYLAHLQQKVTPLFVKLGRTLEQRNRLTWGSDFVKLAEDADYASAARRWYQDNYSTGILW